MKCIRVSTLTRTRCHEVVLCIAMEHDEALLLYSSNDVYTIPAGLQ